VWCQDNNLSFNVNKTKELMVDYRKWRAEHIQIDRAVVEQVESVKFLGVHITKELSWSTHTNTVMEMEHSLRRLKKFGLAPKTLTN
jgi:hypothetical protein